MLFVFLLLTFVLFVLYQMMPANRAYTDARTELQTMKQLSEEEKATKFDELYLKYQRMYGTDTDNKLVLYLRWLGVYPYYDGHVSGILEGNFGFSYEYNKPVIDVIPSHLRNTFLLGVITEVAVLGITIPLGIRCAVKKGSRFDRFTQFFTLIGFSTPSFIIYIIFIVFFCSILHWFPVSGMKTPASPYTGFRAVLDVLHHVALPTICLTFGSLAGITRICRASMIDALNLDCIRTARAKGLTEKVVIYSHAWRNALIPMVSIIVGGFFGTISGAIILEQMFGFKGMGLLFFSSVMTADYDMIMFLEVIYTFIGLFANLVTDLCYGIVDPRVRISK
jgi:peptide/nickel transport system permease protein